MLMVVLSYLQHRSCISAVHCLNGGMWVKKDLRWVSVSDVVKRLQEVFRGRIESTWVRSSLPWKKPSHHPFSQVASYLM